MDWTRYSHLSEAFRTQFGEAPPTIFTPEGAMEYMQRALRGVSAWTGEAHAHEPQDTSRKD